MWHLHVREFPAIVTMDAHGASLHHEIEAASGQQLAGLGSYQSPRLLLAWCNLSRLKQTLPAGYNLL